MKNNRNLIVVSAPSGAGKTTICRAILKKYPQIAYSISYTTRKPRAGEKHKKDYFFITKEEFEKGIKENKWLEWAKVYDNYYGTSFDFIDENIKKNRLILLDVDVQGAKQIFAKISGLTSIFIMPPSFEILKQRLTNRKTETHSQIEKRLKATEYEIAQKDLYQHIIINDNLEDSIEKFNDIIKNLRGKK